MSTNSWYITQSSTSHSCTSLQHTSTGHASTSYGWGCRNRPIEPGLSETSAKCIYRFDYPFMSGNIWMVWLIHILCFPKLNSVVLCKGDHCLDLNGYLLTNGAIIFASSQYFAQQFWNPFYFDQLTLNPDLIKLCHVYEKILPSP